MPKRGPQHHRWKDGKTIQPSGYVRMTAGEYRGWSEHKMVMYLACKEFCYYPILGRHLPVLVESNNIILFHIHHMNFNKQDNRRENLLLVDERIYYGHNVGGRKRDERAQRFIARAEAAQRESAQAELAVAEPSWVVEGKTEGGNGWKGVRE